MKRYEHLMSPFKIGEVEIKNRITLAPMGSGPTLNVSGCFDEQDVEYFSRRAAGGVGAIFTGSVFTDCVVDNYLKGREPGVVSPGDPFINHNPALFMVSAGRFVDNIHSFGTKIFMQMSYGHGSVYNEKGPALLPVPGKPGYVGQALTTEEIKIKVRDYVKAAAIGKEIGFDGIEVHGMHFGFLLDQFSMEYFNNRNDMYGGSFENRHRILCETIEGIKKECGNDFPVTIRLGLKSYLEAPGTPSLKGDHEIGRTLEEGIEICRYLENIGYDALGVDSGIIESRYWHSPPMYQPKGFNLKLAAEAKKAVGIPVMVAGRMNDPDIAEEAIANGEIDAIAIGRGLMADPEFPNKVRAGKVETIRPCLSCQVCTSRLIVGREATCAVNPECRHELYYKLTPAVPPKNILVAGGGVAGLEAARVAKIRGHKVTVYEKTDKLGGNVLPAGMPDFKEDDHKLIRYYESVIRDLGIEVVYNTKVDADLVEKIKPDVVIVATGSIPIMPKSCPGVDSNKSQSCVNALMGENLEQHIVVVGGGLVGCEYALMLSKSGKNVTIVEALPDILKAGKSIAPPAEAMLRDMIKDEGIDVKVSTSVVAITDEGAQVKGADGEYTIVADKVVWSIGFRPAQALVEELKDLPVVTYTIGDGQQARTIQNAIWDGYEVARYI